jgi:hypothetical protein
LFPAGVLLAVGADCDDADAWDDGESVDAAAADVSALSDVFVTDEWWFA